MKKHSLLTFWNDKFTEQADPETERALIRRKMGAGVFDLLRWLALAASDDPARYIINSIFVTDGGSRLIATDGRRLHMVEEKFEHGLADGAWIITKLTKTEIHIFPDVTGSRYPNYKQVIPPDSGKGIQRDTLPFPSSVGRETVVCARAGVVLDSEYLRDALTSLGEKGLFDVIWSPDDKTMPPVLLKLPHGRTVVIMPVRPTW